MRQTFAGFIYNRGLFRDGDKITTTCYKYFIRELVLKEKKECRVSKFFLLPCFVYSSYEAKSNFVACSQVYRYPWTPFARTVRVCRAMPKL